MGLRDDAEALAEGQRAARRLAREAGQPTPQKLWPKANAQLAAQSALNAAENIETRNRANQLLVFNYQ
jgi:hypothetical protein